jgi:dephospho-CoA kinase
MASPRGSGAVTASTGRPAVGRALRIGLTGPIGCGKSTVAGWLAARGAVAIAADAVARAVTAPGEPAHDAALARFGEAVRGPDGALDRAALAGLVFADAAALADLEAIVHPAVRARILAALAAADRSGAPAVVVEAIKLVEGGLADLCDEIWLVACAPATQRARLAGRGMAADDVERRIAAQGNIVGRVLPRATRVLETDGEPAGAEAAAAAALAAALADVPVRAPAGDAGGAGV